MSLPDVPDTPLFTTRHGPICLYLLSVSLCLSVHVPLDACQLLSVVIILSPGRPPPVVGVAAAVVVMPVVAAIVVPAAAAAIVVPAAAVVARNVVCELARVASSAPTPAPPEMARCYALGPACSRLTYEPVPAMESPGASWVVETLDEPLHIAMVVPRQMPPAGS